MSVDEKIKRINLLSPKEQVRRTVSDDNQLQSQQQQQLPALRTQRLSQDKTGFMPAVSPVSSCHTASTASVVYLCTFRL